MNYQVFVVQLVLAVPFSFCRKIYEVLRVYCGSPIHEIGAIELSYAL
jgi:hypothetical protein